MNDDDMKATWSPSSSRLLDAHDRMMARFDAEKKPSPGDIVDQAESRAYTNVIVLMVLFLTLSMAMDIDSVDHFLRNTTMIGGTRLRDYFLILHAGWLVLGSFMTVFYLMMRHRNDRLNRHEKDLRTVRRRRIEALLLYRRQTRLTYTFGLVAAWLVTGWLCVFEVERKHGGAWWAYAILGATMLAMLPLYKPFMAWAERYDSRHWFSVTDMNAALAELQEQDRDAAE